MTLNRYSRTQYAADWTGQVTEIKEAKKERDRLYSIMTAYERQTVAEYIGDLAEKNRGTIEAGALAVWEGAKNHLKSALQGVEIQKRKIANGYDSAKLESEMSLVQRRMEIAAKGDNAITALKDLYAEYQQSGDKTKQKAAGEVFQSVLNLIPQSAQDSHGSSARMAANRIAKQAAADLQTSQTSPELTAAHEMAAAKTAELNQAKNLLNDTAEVLGDGSPNGTIRNTAFINALATVQQDSGGNFIFKE